MILGKVICVVLYNLLLTVLIKAFLCGYFDILRFLHFTKKPDSFENQVFKWCHQESNRGHKDFQSFALPTELWHQHFYVCNQYFSIAVAKVRKLLELANISAEKMRFLCKKWHFCGKSTDNSLKKPSFFSPNKGGD